jgi:hypothetical protein
LQKLQIGWSEAAGKSMDGLCQPPFSTATPASAPFPISFVGNADSKHLSLAVLTKLLHLILIRPVGTGAHAHVFAAIGRRKIGAEMEVEEIFEISSAQETVTLQPMATELR